MCLDVDPPFVSCGCVQVFEHMISKVKLVAHKAKASVMCMGARAVDAAGKS
jgi:hypothetical protein